MANRNTRIDVEVNTQNARNQLRELANDTTRINNQTNSTSTSTASAGNSRAQDVNQTINLLRQQSAQREKEIQQQFNSLRKANLSEYEEFSQKHKTGRISDDEFNNYRKGFADNQIDSFGDERDELSENTRRTNDLIQELIDRQDENTRSEVVASQRDNSEHAGGGEGILKKLFGKRSELMEQRLNAGSESEIKDVNKQLDKVNKEILRKSGGGSRIADTITEGGNLASSVMQGGGAQAAMGMLSKAGPYGMAAAAVLAVLGGGVMLGNERDKTVANLTSYRALGDREVVNKSIEDNDITRHGLDADSFINKRKELLLASGRYQGGSAENTMDAVRLERGYGIESIAALSGNERQDKYGKSTAENTLEMLNVLSAIKDGSISVDDLTLANEKAQLMNRLQSSQISRQEKFDNQQVLGLMTAFEKLGGEGKDQRAGNFIEGTLGAMREGGNQNMMMLKHQFAIDAHPELANDPAALSRMIEEGSDPAYITSSLKGLKKMFGGNKQAQYFGFKEFFKGSGLTASEREKVAELAGSEEGLSNIMGQGLNNYGKFNQNNADAYSYDKTQKTEETLADIKKQVGNIGEWFKSLFKDPIDVNIKNADKNGNPRTSVEKSTVPGGRNR